MTAIAVTVAATGLLLLVGCSAPPTSNDRQNDAQSTLASEASAEVGMPGMTNFTEKKLVRKLYELRDHVFETFTYVPTLDGRLMHVCDSIGYGIPYGVQFTAPEHMDTWFLSKAIKSSLTHYGIDKLPQPEPNGLFMPPTAEGTWVMCGNKSKISPVYIEPRVIVSPFKLHAAGEWMDSETDSEIAFKP